MGDLGGRDLTVVIVSANDGGWLPGCLSSLAPALEGVSSKVVVVDNGSLDDTASVVRERFPDVHLIEAENRGFAAGNNRALPACDARYVLFLNPDTEILAGRFADLLGFLDANPKIGLLGCRHVMPDGGIQRTIRRFPSPGRVWGQAIGCERLPFGLARLGERVLDDAPYERVGGCDWVSGSFMLVRAETIAAAGFMDERFFLYSEETDLCLRVRRAGWRVVFSPQMTILHHAGRAGLDSRLQAQSAFARRQYARKHFGGLRGGLFRLGLVFHYALRSAMGRSPFAVGARHRAADRCLRVALGLKASPFPVLTSVAVHRVNWPKVSPAQRSAERRSALR